MEKLYYNLSEEEFTKGRKILLWFFTVAFFVGGVYVAMLGPVFGKDSITPASFIVPLCISFVIGGIAAYATIKRKNLYFLIDDEKVEFRFGVFRPKKYSFLWSDMKKIVLPHKPHITGRLTQQVVENFPVAFAITHVVKVHFD